MADDQHGDLRRRALKILHGQPIDLGNIDANELEAVLHELRVHEIELQLQNEELRKAQHQLEDSYRKYTELYDFAPVGYLTLNRQGAVEEANLTATRLLNLGREQLFQLPFVSHVAAAYRPVFLGHQKRLFESQSSQRDEVEMIKGDGTQFFAQLDSTVVLDREGEPVQQHMVLSDITQRKQIEIAEYEQRVFADSMRSIAHALNRTLHLDDVLSLIMDNVNYVVQHDIAEVMLFEDGFAKVVGSKGYTAHELEERVMPMQLPISEAPNLQKIMQTGQPVLIADIQAEPEWIQVVFSKKQRAYIGAPIHLDQRVIGCLNVFNREPDYYTAKHAERLQAFAGQTGTAIKNAQLYRQVQEVAALQERQRLARDLHDAVSQSLFSASMIAEALPQLVERNPSALLVNLDKLLRLTRGAMAEMRALLLELRPGTLERYTLAELLLQLAQALQGRKQIDVDLQLNNQEVMLPFEVKETIYRITQEALNNIIRHADADHIAIRLDGSSQQIALSLHDNGRGFDIGHANSGIGLHSMQERAQAIHADLSIQSMPGQGTSIDLVWKPPH